MEGLQCKLKEKQHEIGILILAHPSLQEMCQEMESSGCYRGVIPETVKLINIIMALPVGTSTAERSSSQTKLMETCL